MPEAQLDFRDQFLSMLNNRDKARSTGFVVFVHGALDLEPLEELCFRTDQTYNTCLTARYGAGQGDVLPGLFGAFVREARSFLGPDPVAGQGNFRATLADDRKGMIRKSLQRIKSKGESFPIEQFLSFVEGTFQVGERLVLFCELLDIPQDAALEDLGLDIEVIDKILLKLPERMGLVFSGLPENLRLTGPGDRLLEITIGPDSDYGEERGTAPERSQPLRNDSPRGEDRLAITSEVNALADAIAGKDMDPPLVVGILGGWGSGKSFILHLLEERLRFIRNQDLSNDQAYRNSPYVGHPYLVRFNAWTYAKSDLWASLMEQTLSDLDQQLNLERTIAPKYELRRGFDLWEIIAHTTEDQLKALEQALGQEAVALIKDWKQGGGTAKALWEALETLRSEELKKLGKAVQALSKQEKTGAEELQNAQIESEQKLLSARQKAERRLSRMQQKHNNTLAKKEAEREAVQARIAAEVDREMEAIARQAAWTPVRDELESFLGAAADDVLQKSGAASDGAPVSIWQVEKEVSLALKYWTGLRKSSASLPFLAFAILSLLVSAYLVQNQLASLTTSLAGYLGVAGGVLGSGYTALAKVNRWFEAGQASYENKMERARSEMVSLRESKLAAKREEKLVPIEQSIGKLKNQFAVDLKTLEETESEGLKNLQLQEEKSLAQKKSKNEEKIHALEEQVEEHRRRAGIPGQHKSLTELIQKRIQSGYYHQRLGILHQVQKDLEEITEALLPLQGYDEKLFPRGAPRIILLIDDLDRCPPKQVVQVLEAAQLLVKTRLFVVVIAMDIRFVTRALEKEYEGILVRDGNPSGLDYTEKIVQIPYRVRPIEPAAMTGYLRSQVEIRPGEEAAGPEPQINGGGRPLPAEVTSPGRANTRVDESLPPEIQQFDPEEVELLASAANSVEINPRATKRLVNVMKIIKNIWYRKSLPQPPREIEQAVILLLTLSASYPEMLARILDELEAMYHDTVEMYPSPKLQSVLQGLIERWCQEEGSETDWATITRLIQDPSLLSPDLTLEQLRLDNLQAILSFSFLGEVEMPLVEKKQRHEVALSPFGDITQLSRPAPEQNKRSRRAR